MSEVKYTILDENLNSIPENEVISDNDLNLIDNYQISKRFNSALNYVEGHIYSLSNELLFSNYAVDLNFDVESSNEGSVDSLSFDPSEFTSDSGFEYSDVKAVFHFLDDVYTAGAGKAELYIDSISSDRKEILLYSNDLSDNSIINITEDLNERFKSGSFFDEIYFNVGDNDLLIATNVDLYEKEDKFTVAVKLYEPLPNKYNLKQTGNLVEKLSDSVAVRVDVTITEEEEITPKLKGANFNIELDTDDITPTGYFNYNELFSYDINNSNKEIFSYLNESSVDINLDHSDYANFVHFSSAEERLKNFRYKLRLIENYQENLDSVNATTQGSITSSQNKYKKLIEGVVKNFDHYENFLYFESGSSTWPKSSTSKPHSNFHSTSSEAINWYAGQLTSASSYDSTNYDLLSATLPSYIREDSNNSNAILFVHMLGHHYDNLWIYTKAVTDKYDNDNRLDFGISQDLVRETLRGFGVKLYNSQEGEKDLFKYLIADTYESGSNEEVINTFTTVPGVSVDAQPLSRKNYEGELYKRIYHNLPFLMKAKGTKRGLRALINCFGIPSSFLSINEYGGQIIGSNKFVGYENGSEKVRFETRVSGSVGKVLTEDESIQKTENDRTQDIHRLEVGFSPATSINNYILSVLSNSFNIDDYIGDPRDENKSSYVDLDKIAFNTLHNNVERTQLNDFIRILKFYDNVLFKMIKDFVPAKATLDTGIIIKPHILDRSKIKSPDMTGTRPEYSGSIDTAFTTGSQAGVYDDTSIAYSTSHSLDINTMTGSVVKPITDESPMYNGELSGSHIEVTDGELNKPNIFKQVNVPVINYDITARDAGSGASYTAFTLSTTSQANGLTAPETACLNINNFTTAYHNGNSAIPRVGDFIFDGINDATGKNGSGNWWLAKDSSNNTFALRISGSGGNVGFVGNKIACSNYDNTPPSGYTATWSMIPQSILTNNSGAVPFTIFDAEIGTTYNVTASLASAPNTKATATGTITGEGAAGTLEDFSGTINCTSLADGPEVHLDVTLVDAAGNRGGLAGVGGAPGNTLTASVKDTNTPSGYSVLFTNSSFTSAQAVNDNGTFYILVSNLPANDSGSISYTLTSSGGGASYTSTNNSWSTPLTQTKAKTIYSSQHNLSAGTITVQATVFDTAGNQGATVTDTVSYSNVSGTMTQTSGQDSDNLSYYSQTFTFNVNVTPNNATWYLTTTGNPSWLTVYGQSGSGDDSAVYASVSSNTTSSFRLTSIVLKATGSGTTLATLPVGQNAQCVAPHTLILMGDGSQKKAGELKVGDVVKTKHENSLEELNANVNKVKISNSERIKVVIGDKEIVCSPLHRFYVDNKNAFENAINLVEGDILSGKEFISREEYSNGEVVSISVENAATYISEGILSHNIK